MLLLKNEMYSVFFHTFIPVRTSYLSAVTSVNALDNVAVRIEETVTPIIIHSTENEQPSCYGLWSLVATSETCIKFFNEISSP